MKARNKDEKKFEIEIVRNVEKDKVDSPKLPNEEQKNEITSPLIKNDALCKFSESSCNQKLNPEQLSLKGTLSGTIQKVETSYKAITLVSSFKKIFIVNCS